MQLNWIKRLINTATVIVSILFTILFVNFLFNMAMPGIVSQEHFPRQLIRELGPHYQTFYPTVNDGTFKNWTAVLGDSYAAGFGDAYINNERDYGIFHHIHNQTGENFYIFARGGYGSIHSVREYFLTSREIDRAIFYPKREDPQKLLLLFYEGNDLSNNFDHYKKYDGASYSTIGDFVIHEIEKSPSSSRWSEFYLPVSDLIDLDSLKTLFSLKNGDERRAKQRPDNVILFEDGRSILYPRFAGGTSPELSDKEVEISLDIFFASIRYLKEKTGSIPISIVYIPSPVTTYHWKNPVQVRSRDSGEKIMFVNFEDGLKRSQYIRKRMAEFSSQQTGVDLVDATDAVTAAARTNYLHGIEDPGHFNSAGYQLISKLLMK